MNKALWQVPVSYGAVGATQAADLLKHPPAGFRAIERRRRIGHGDARFAYACAQLMSWGIQKNSGMRVTVADRPPEWDDEPHFGPDGTAFLLPGDTATLFIPIVGGLGVRAPARVVYVIDEPTRKGFAYGTLPGHPESGEEAFIVDQREDGSVWLTIRAFSRPSTGFWRVVYPALRIAQEIFTRRYLRALTGPIE